MKNGYWIEPGMETHECAVKVSHHENDTEMDGSLGVYPNDSEIYKNFGEWWLGMNEYFMPIIFCPFCGEDLD